MKKFARLPFALVLFLFVACAPPEQTTDSAGDPELERLAARAGNVTIIRDDFGVPHIYAKTDADAVFGMLYAQAEDDYPRIERNYVWAIGRLAEVEGESALISDLRARLYMSTEDAIAAYESAPDWLKALCNSWADGLNYYLAMNPDAPRMLLDRYEPWMPMYFFEGSIGGDIEQVPLRGIEAFYGGEQPAAATLASNAEEPGYREPGGSNGFAISGDHTASGNAMLLINPHTTFYFRGEIHVVSEEGLNAYGAMTWGQFFVYQGFNEDTGWMHTSTDADFMDEFVEDVFEENGQLFYRYGDEARPVQVSDVTLKYSDGDAMSERTFPMYHTHHGPITHLEDGKWTATRINWDPVNALTQSFIRTKQSNHEEFWEMMNIRTNSSNNTVYADSSGNIAYYHGNFMPKRNPQFDFSMPVDGSNPATDWLGLHTVDEIVTVVNPGNGWIQNCNSTPFTAAGAFSPVREDYPAYMAPDPENFRGIHAARLMEGISEMTLDSLIELAYDPYLPGFENLVPGLVEAYDDVGDVSYQEPMRVMREWDFRTSADSVAMTVAHFFATNFLRDGDLPEDLARAPLMERINYLATESGHEERMQVFYATIRQLDEQLGSWNTAWGEVNRLQRLSGDIDQQFDVDKPFIPVGLASGDWGALASFRGDRRADYDRIFGNYGNSFVAVVEFGDRVRAKTILAGGQSGDPDSPHFFDQGQRYADVDFKEAAFYREDVEARAVRTYHPGE